VYYTIHNMVGNAFGSYVRERREARRAGDPAFSLRRLAARIGVEPSYLSKVERGETPPPSEEKIRLLAEALGEDPDLLLALAGKVSSDLQEIIRRRPRLFASLIRRLAGAEDEAVEGLVRRVRDGKW
jgi:transcriptional regulator with XRE-family HTH domain